MLDYNFDNKLEQYKFTQTLKKTNPELYNGGVSFNQKISTVCGKIDATLQQLSADERTTFIEENTKFFEGFTWIYYQGWRKTRGKSIAHLIDIYKLLNVKFIVSDFRGETFYAGIPPVTIDEVNISITEQVRSQGIKFAQEKIGNDGKLHPCDEYGDFLPVTPQIIMGNTTNKTGDKL